MVVAVVWRLSPLTVMLFVSLMRGEIALDAASATASLSMRSLALKPGIRRAHHRGDEGRGAAVLQCTPAYRDGGNDQRQR